MAKLWQFWQGDPKAAFSEKRKRGTKGNFSKIAQKDILPEKAQKHSGARSLRLALKDQKHSRPNRIIL